ncbi:uncharacterized protein LOC8282361 [Ricinus communis]|uniref:CUE domain-containing protein n=1 Tax=Ricinus communis TaxID=3988 RepID=B9RV91_RICCO|nr:uncharacterized protein LOC8282361 [Ricinus communis]EEF44824.1 conserved hypothetical protein [Ricinus communis]|eukprot:XP_002517660.1 uncharacterized protein LOC8282361 [Ricinus communis]
MSAIVCGSKRSHYYFDEEFPSTPVSKRHRCSSSSPPHVRFSPPPSPFLHLKSLFPLLDPQLLEKALEECGNDLESAIKSLNEQNSCFVEEAAPKPVQDALPDEGDATASGNVAPPTNLPVDGAEWVDLLVREMMSATSVDDAKSRASRVLEALEKSIHMHAADETAQSFEKESVMLKEQIEALIRDNTILKRAVAIQHERQKEFEEKNRELQQLKQLVSQYQEQLKSLEVNNYTLMMHLRQAEQSSPIPGRFHPDVF